AHVHQDDAGPEGTDYFGHVWIAEQGRHVVDDVGARLEGLPRDLGLAGVDGKRDVAARRQLAHDGDDAAEFLVEGDGFGVGAGGFAADVEQVGALADEFEAVGHGGVGGGVPAAVGEAVGGDVDDPHYQRGTAGRQDAVTQLPDEGRGHPITRA